MADIILVKLENEEASRNLATPFGILLLADCLEKAGFSVQLMHEVGTRDNVQAVVELVLREKPLFVGFSTLTGPPLLPAIQASRQIRRRSDVVIVWGGLHATMLPEQTLLNGFIDLVVIGEGEATAVELAHVLRRRGYRWANWRKQLVYLQERWASRRYRTTPFYPGHGWNLPCLAPPERQEIFSPFRVLSFRVGGEREQ